MPLKNRNLAIAFALMAFLGMIVYADWTLVYTPIQKTMAEDRSKVDELNAKLAVAKQRAGQLNKIQAEMANLQIDVAQLEKQLPKDRELPSLIRVLTHRAESYGLLFTALTPGRPVPKGLYDEIPYSVVATSSFHSLGHFLTAMGKGERLFATRNLSLTSSATKTDPTKTVSAQFTLVSFKYHE
jgi:type IV pilus assembly protein PilO